MYGGKLFGDYSPPTATGCPPGYGPLGCDNGKSYVCDGSLGDSRGSVDTACLINIGSQPACGSHPTGNCAGGGGGGGRGGSGWSAVDIGAFSQELLAYGCVKTTAEANKVVDEVMETLPYERAAKALVPGATTPDQPMIDQLCKKAGGKGLQGQGGTPNVVPPGGGGGGVPPVNLICGKPGLPPCKTGMPMWQLILIISGVLILIIFLVLAYRYRSKSVDSGSSSSMSFDY